MNPTNYTIKSHSTTLSHFPAVQPIVRDTDDHADVSQELMMHARARSGDYLMTLAIELDVVAQELAATDAALAPEIERLVAELIYLNRDYAIRKK
ncbi:MAG TPA: hypothetical protein VF575_01020 [Candidatus Saccharimonadales bacterium]|jgi:hypothetical protein